MDEDEAAFGGFDDENAEATLSVECVGFANGDLRWAASGGMDNTLKVWDIVTGSCRSVCAHGGSVVALRWHSSLPVISTAALDYVLRVWDARGGKWGYLSVWLSLCSFSAKLLYVESCR
jgi:WD40 repeat protein